MHLLLLSETSQCSFIILQFTDSKEKLRTVKYIWPVTHYTWNPYPPSSTHDTSIRELPLSLPPCFHIVSLDSYSIPGSARTLLLSPFCLQGTEAQGHSLSMPEPGLFLPQDHTSYCFSWNPMWLPSSWVHSGRRDANTSCQAWQHQH